MVTRATAEEVVVLVDVEAPEPPSDPSRSPQVFQVVLERSETVGAERLDRAVQALLTLVARLDPRDSFGVVTFADTADVIVPAGPAADREMIRRQLRSIRSRGGREPVVGVARGLEEVRRVSSPRVGSTTLLVIADRCGPELDPELVALLATARGRGVTPSVLAIDDDLAAGLATRVPRLLPRSVEGAGVTLRLQPSVDLAPLNDDLVVRRTSERSVTIDLGDLYAAEHRRLVLRFCVPGRSDLGRTHFADVEVRHRDVGSGAAHSVSLPLTVDVVPRDQVGSRVTDHAVSTEARRLSAQQAVRRASGLIEVGSISRARVLLDEARRELEVARVAAPSGLVDDVHIELVEVRTMIDGIHSLQW